MKIGIIGLGLIGGSIFKSLYKEHELIGVSRTVTGKNISNNYETLKNCELIFVCTPMNKTLEILDKLEEILPSTTIVTDVCSLKSFVSKKKYKYKFIPSHPMAGTENNGWDSSFEGLFNGAKWVITPLGNEIIPEQETLETIITELGADIVITTPEEHDKAVALISHMPMLVAQALCQNIKNNKLAQIIAASGFRDTTRLALSNIEMATDMIEMNTDNIKASINTLNDCIEGLLDTNYKTQAENIKNFRKELYN